MASNDSQCCTAMILTFLLNILTDAPTNVTLGFSVLTIEDLQIEDMVILSVLFYVQQLLGSYVNLHKPKAILVVEPPGK